jgi:putative glycosyltransferase (TIGR04372 family)
MPALLKRAGRKLIHVLALLVSRVLGVRLVVVTHPERIGHLCLEPDCLVKEGLLGMRPNFRPVLLLPESKISNPALARLWEDRLWVVTSEFWCDALGRIAALPGLQYPVDQYAVAIDQTARAPAILARWGERTPVLSLDPDFLRRGREALERLGLPPDAWFACVHSREGGYSPSDEHLHSYRNSGISSYALAMEKIVRAGGWCVRVGESSTQPLAPRPGVIDYAHSNAKSDWMDVYLCSECRFFLGNSSGLYTVANAFGRPSALANMTPLSVALPVGYGDIGIPKMLRRDSDGSYLSLAGILGSPVANYRFSSQYVADGIVVVENSPEEIGDLVTEMLARIDGTLQYTKEDDRLQAAFHALIRPGHYCYGAASRIGRDFLRKYSRLLD